MEPIREIENGEVVLRKLAKKYHSKLDEPKVFLLLVKKGGMGKSTSVINVAGAWARAGLKTLIIDLTDQANTTYIFLKSRKPDPSIYEFLIDEDDEVGAADVLYSTEIENIDIVPSHHIKMDSPDRALEKIMGNQFLLKRLLDQVKQLETRRFDAILVDVPANFGILAVNALMAGDRCIIPLDPDIFGLQGIEDTLRAINLAQKRINPALSISGVLLTKVENTNIAKEVREQLYDHFGNIVFDVEVPKNTAIKEAHTRGTVFQHKPSSSGALAYEALAIRLLEKELCDHG